MSQSRRISAAARQNGATPPRGRGSASTAEGLAGERALLAARFRGGETARVTRAARRLENASRADARAAWAR